MSRPEDHLSRRDAEHLLDAPATHDSALGRALTAAAAPAQPHELRREESAVAAFHRARVTPAPAVRSDFVSPQRLASRAATRAVIATSAVVALTSGGFALANVAHLPLLPGQASDRASESVAKTPGPSSSSTSSTSTSATDPSTGASTSSDTSTESAGTHSASPTPDLEGLCKAYQAADHSADGASLDSAAFTALAAAAGGADKVATFCVDLVGAPRQTGKPSELPTPTSRPTPTVKPTPTTRSTPTTQPTPPVEPTGSPSLVPSPTDKPTPSKPTDRPTPGAGRGGGKGSTTSGS